MRRVLTHALTYVAAILSILLGSGIANAQALPPGASLGNTMELTVQARNKMPSPGSQQVVYMRLTDAGGQGISNVRITVTVREGTDSHTYSALATDRRGYTRCRYTVGEAAPGTTVILQACATVDGEAISGRTCYMVW